MHYFVLKGFNIMVRRRQAMVSQKNGEREKEGHSTQEAGKRHLEREKTRTYSGCTYGIHFGLVVPHVDVWME